MFTLAVVVLSGGLDSATALGLAVHRHSNINTRAITFEYGQRHAQEVLAAAQLCDHYRVGHTIIPLPKGIFEGGVLTTESDVPDMHYDDLPSGQMSPTYVPFRNANLLSQAVAFADSKIILGKGASAQMWDEALVYAGMHSEDAAGFAYADCTPEFLGAMASAIYIGTYGRVRLQSVFQHMKKSEIIRLGASLRVPYELTHSCYRGQSPACGHCATCYARLEAFKEARLTDPLEYADNPQEKLL